MAVIEPKLSLHRRLLPWADKLPTLRWSVAVLLVSGLILGGWQWWVQTKNAGALEFTPHTIAALSTAIGVLDFKIADLDNDGDKDIVTTGLDGTKVYENTGNQAFQMKIIDDKPGERVYLADFNGDGQTDFLVTLKGGQTAMDWYRNTTTMEYKGTAFGSGTDAKAAVGDIDGDHAPDIVSATTEGDKRVLRQWINDGHGGFDTITPIILSADSGVTTVAIGGIAGGGYPDIVTGGTGGLQHWHTKDAVMWNRSDIDDQNPNQSSIAITDVDNDGLQDIVTGDQSANSVALYHNENNTFWRRSLISIDESVDASTVIPADLDGDGNPDVVVASQDDNELVWYHNEGSLAFSSKQVIAGSLQSVYSAAVADLDGDGNLDIVSGDHFQGAVYWYQRVRAKPVATAPSSITQSTDGSGRVSFQTTVSDEDKHTTQMRVQYSFDGTHWYKPWLTSVKSSAGSADLKNSNGYQIGTSNAIDTDKNDSITLTMTWDTKSSQNTGGPVVGDPSTILLRVLPRDSQLLGSATTSNTFLVDNQIPKNLTLLVNASAIDSVTLIWPAPTDKSAMSYRLTYNSATWDTSDDPMLSDTATTTTTVTGLQAGKAYSFKLYVKDKYGNESASAAVVGRTLAADSTVSPTPTASGGVPVSPTPTVSSSPNPSGTPIQGTTVPATPTPSVEGSPVPGESTTPTPTESVSPTPTPSPTIISVLDNNNPPVADAGTDQVVNPSALVILDGSASNDPDKEPLSFEWRQIDGSSVDLLSDHTATPSFAAGGENQTYIFQLTVHDTHGAASTDNVTIATKALPSPTTVPVQVSTTSSQTTTTVEAAPESPLVASLRLLDSILFALSLLSTSFSLIERVVHALSQRRLRPGSFGGGGKTMGSSRVVHYKTGDPVAGAQVLIYGSDGKLRNTARTNAQGYFETLFPPGQYSLGIEAPGFSLAGSAALTVRPETGVLYTGGTLTVPNTGGAPPIVIPLKPTTTQVSSSRAQFLHAWQTSQRVARIVSWPIFLGGALLNTILVFISPGLFFLVLEVCYVFLVITKIALEIRVRPAYGLVRDALTHVPLDLAVVRLFTTQENRLVMTRVTNNQGKFFALPPPGKYTVTVTKPGYATFSKQNVVITDEHDATLQMTTDLLPLAPHGSLQQAKAAIV